MNIFTLDDDPIQAAIYIDDRRVGKMGLEACQMLSTTFITQHLPDILTPRQLGMLNPKQHARALGIYAPTHPNHPCNRWLAQSPHNTAWLFLHARACFHEHFKRFGTVHKSLGMLNHLFTLYHHHVENYDSSLYLHHTPFPGAASHPHPDPIQSMRRYYNDVKAYTAEYTRGTLPPTWFQPRRRVQALQSHGEVPGERKGRLRNPTGRREIQPTAKDGDAFADGLNW